MIIVTASQSYFFCANPKSTLQKIKINCAT